MGTHKHKTASLIFIVRVKCNTIIIVAGKNHVCKTIEICISFLIAINNNMCFIVNIIVI